MAKIIRNIDGVAHTYAGQEIAPSESYTIQGMEQIRWANDDDLMSDIGAGKAQVNDGTSDIAGISNQINFLKDIDNITRDSDGSPIQRTKITQSGWHYCLRCFEIKTSTLDALVNTNHEMEDIGDVSVKFYDIDGVELITDLSTCVKTVVDFEPLHDYEVVGGGIKVIAPPVSDIRVWCIGVPDVPDQYGGSKLMIDGFNFRFLSGSDSVEADGRASKYMTYNATYHTNKLRFIFRHNAGVQHDFHIFLETYES